MKILILLIFNLLSSNSLFNNLVLENQKGGQFHLQDTLNKYLYSIIVYSHYKQAKLGKGVRKELEKKFGKQKEIKVIEIANLSFIKGAGLFKTLIKGQFKIVKRDILLDYDGVIEKKFGFEKDKLNVYIFQRGKFLKDITGLKKDDILEKISKLVNIKVNNEKVK